MTDTSKSRLGRSDYERRRCAPASYRLGKNAANRRRTQQRCPLGTAGVVRYFFRVFRVEAYGISVARIFFFLSVIRKITVAFSVRRSRQRFSRIAVESIGSRDGLETETRVGIGESVAVKRASRGQNRSARVGWFFFSRVPEARATDGLAQGASAREGRDTKWMLFGGCKNESERMAIAGGARAVRSRSSLPHTTHLTSSHISPSPSGSSVKS